MKMINRKGAHAAGRYAAQVPGKNGTVTVKPKFSAVLLIVALALGLTVGCRTLKNEAAQYTPGIYTVSQKGYGGEVTVSVTVDSKAITSVRISGDRETPSIGGRAVKAMSAEILTKGDKVEAVSGATFTSTAIKAALSEALARAKGKKVSAALTLNDGTYESSARGFHLVNLVPITVKISANRIAAIAIGKNGERRILR
ncbi:MAG: FMN-binding protein [Treponemataceae bacterium]